MHDIAIAGAGPVGATLALALHDADLDIVVADARAPGPSVRPDRTLALSHGARLIFERIGIWTPLAAEDGAVTPILTIDISQAGGFGGARLTAGEQGLPALGYVVSYHALQRVLDDAMGRAGIDVRFGAAVSGVEATSAAAALRIAGGDERVAARLVVVADGAASTVPGIPRDRHDYGQVAIVASVWLDEPQRGTAYERFTADGPIALLPKRDHHALVWTQDPVAASRALAMSDAAFLATLGARFGSRAARFVQVKDRGSFPLALEVAASVTGTRTAMIGNAAQALHPIAGQGFNLGLRDAWDLSRIVVDTPRESIGTPGMLARYRRRRERDRRAGIAFTHGLVRLFGNDRPWLRLPRGMGLVLLDTLPFAKRAFSRAMLFGIR